MNSAVNKPRNMLCYKKKIHSHTYDWRYIYIVYIYIYICGGVRERVSEREREIEEMKSIRQICRKENQKKGIYLMW